MLQKLPIVIAVCIVSLIVSIPWAHASDLFVVIGGRKVSNVVTVAKRGGNFTNVQAAVDSITDATSLNPYLVVIAPGIYDGVVNLKPDIHLQGAGQNVTILHSTVGNDGMLPTRATLVLDDRTSVRDLTVLNLGGTDYHHVALMVAIDATAAMNDVTVYATIGGSAVKSAIYFYGCNSTLTNVTAEASGGSDYNYGAQITEDATVVMYGGKFTGRGGNSAYGIRGAWLVDTKLETSNTKFIAIDGNSNTGLSVGGQVTLRGGTISASGGGATYGLATIDGTSLDAANLFILAKNGTSYNVSCSFYDSSSANIYHSVLETDTYAWETIGSPISLTLSHSRLIGGSSSAAVACTAVSRGTTFNASGCP